MARPLHLPLLVSIAAHGLAMAALHLPTEAEPEAPPKLMASLRAQPFSGQAVPQEARVQPAPREKPAGKPLAAAPMALAAAARADLPIAPVQAAPPEERSSNAGPAVTAPSPPAPAAPAPAPAPALEPPRYNAAYLANPPPPYPSSARRRGIEGAVMLEARVSPAGDAREVKIAASAGDEALDEAALRAVLGWRFEPARRGSQAVEAWVRIPVVFKLN